MAAPHGAPPPSRSTPAVTGGAAGPERSSMRSTQLFGGGSAKPPVSTATQAFGAVAGAQSEQAPAASAPAGKTQAFGAVSAKGQGADNATQNPGAVPPGLVRTQTFGAAPAAGNATQTFGAVPPVGQGAAGVSQASTSAPPGASVGRTQMFGAAPATGQGPGNATQTFGAVPSLAPEGQTQSFGTVPFRGPAADGGASGREGVPGAGTQAFGAVPPVAPVIPPVGRTQTYGAVSGQRHGVPGQVPSAPGNATQTFGAYTPTQADAPMTPDFGSVPTPPPVSPFHAGASHAAPPGSTATEAVPPSFSAPPVSDARAPLGRSQTFSAVQSPAPEAPVGSKRVFGSVPPVSPPGDFPGAAAESSSGAAESASSARTTNPFGLSQLNLGDSSSDAQAPSSGPRTTNTFGLSPPSGSDSGIQLPPETEPPFAGGLSALDDSGASDRGPAGGSSPLRAPLELPADLISSTRMSAEGTRTFEHDTSSRVRPRVVLAILVGLGLLALLGHLALKNREVKIPSAVVEETDRASVLLRRDDTASRDDAIKQLRDLSTANPRYVEAHAELAVALTLNLSDAQAEAERLRLQGDAIARGLEAASQIRVRADQDARRTALQQEQQAVARDTVSVRATTESLRKELDAHLTQLSKAPESESTSAAAARVKARALHASVLAAPDALALAERLRKAETAPHAWSTLARAEYVLSAGSPPDSLTAVASDLEGLRKADSTLLRAYLLGARVALRLKDTATARSLLDDALALNPNHQAAKRLIAQIDADAPAAP
ncbi:hypothetical protein ACLEPN_06550 [Myxococcus sp. 1LA]